MRWKDVNLLKEKPTSGQLAECNLIDRTTDVYLATTISHLSEEDYKNAKETLTDNPFNYLTSEKEVKGITALDQFTFRYQGKFISIGGFLIQKNISNKQKNKILKKQIKNWSSDYSDFQKGKIRDISNKMDVLNDFNLPKFPKQFIIANIVIEILLILINFPTKKLKTLSFFNKIASLKVVSLICLIIASITLISEIIFQIYVVNKERQKNIVTKQVKVLDKNLKNKLTKLTNVINKQYHSASKRINKGKYSQMYLTSLKKHQKKLNVNHLIEDYLTNLSKVKQNYKLQKKINIILLIASYSTLLALIVFIIRNLIK